MNLWCFPPGYGDFSDFAGCHPERYPWHWGSPFLCPAAVSQKRLVAFSSPHPREESEFVGGRHISKKTARCSESEHEKGFRFTIMLQIRRSPSSRCKSFSRTDHFDFIKSPCTPSCHHVIVSLYHRPIMSSSHPAIMSTCHHGIVSSCHRIIISSPHHIIMSPCYHVFLRSCHHGIMSPPSCRHAIVKPCHHVTTPSS